MTDYRGTEQELWDEEASGDEVRRTSEPASERALVHQTVSQPTPVAEDEDQTLVDSVARFIAEPGPVSASRERELDAPRRSLAALELLDAEDEAGAEATGLRAPPLPPALPPDVKPVELTPLLLRPSKPPADVTERVNTIPRTHPMANSIAPGGSALSTPPAPRRSLRWQAALGVAALLAIGGASRLLQSRGEHHAASGSQASEDEDEQMMEARRASAAAHEKAQAEAAARARARAEQAERQRGDAERLASQSAQPYGPPPPSQKAIVSVQVPASEPAAESRQPAVAPRRIQVGVGGAQLLEHERQQASAQSEATAPVDRMQIAAALSKLTPQLQQCVGDEHGIADVTLTVRAPGIVSHALVEGAYAGSEKGTCIARALRAAKLPALPEPVSRIEYPFQL